MSKLKIPYLDMSKLRRNPVYLVATFFAFGYLLYSVVIIAFPSILGFNPREVNLGAVLLPPSLKYPFGTDALGKGMLQQVFYGAPFDAEASIAVIVTAFSIGLVLGTVAGFFGGIVDDVIMRVTDVFLAFPGLVLAVAVAAALGPGMINAILALTVVWWPIYTRIARGETISVKERQFIMAAKSSGQSRGGIVTSHVIPNVLTSMVAYATADIGNVIIIFSVLGYLGLGPQPPTVDLGRLVYDGQNYIQIAPWYPIIPGIVILVIVLAFTFTGDYLSEIFNPKMRV